MGKKILIVDDEPHIRVLLEQTLEDFEDEDVEILIAKDGQEGLEIIKEDYRKVSGDYKTSAYEFCYTIYRNTKHYIPSEKHDSGNG